MKSELSILNVPWKFLSKFTDPNFTFTQIATWTYLSLNLYPSNHIKLPLDIHRTCLKLLGVAWSSMTFEFDHLSLLLDENTIMVHVVHYILPTNLQWQWTIWAEIMAKYYIFTLQKYMAIHFYPSYQFTFLSVIPSWSNDWKMAYLAKDQWPMIFNLCHLTKIISYKCLSILPTKFHYHWTSKPK